MHSVEAALAHALAIAPSTESESVALVDAVGRVLREPLIARADVPIAPSSMMDGYAIDSAGALRLRVGVESAAGAPRSNALSAGEAAPISTGALLPPGADAVVPIEQTRREGAMVVVHERPRAGAFLRAIGSDLRAGETLLSSGDLLSPTALALFAGEGRAQITVARKPHIAILSMGRELRPLGVALAPGELHDQNGPALRALCVAAGATATLRSIVADDPGALAAQLAIPDADFVLTSGGASVGPHDHLRTAIERAGGDVLLWRVAMKPGKPLVLARLNERPVVGLPGNPVSAIVSFYLFVHPMIRAMLGVVPHELPSIRVQLDGPLPAAGDRRTYIRARLRYEAGAPIATPEGRQASSALLSLHRAHVLIATEPGEAGKQAGEYATAILLPR